MNDSKEKEKDQVDVIKNLVMEENRKKEIKEFILEGIKQYKKFPDKKKKMLSEKLSGNVITSSAKNTITEVAGECDSDPLKYTAYLINKNKPELLK